MLQASYTAYPLYFHLPAGTSRGVLHQKPCWFIRLRKNDGSVGTGEVSFIPGLSVEDPDELELNLDHICKLISRGEMDPMQPLPSLPGIQFALECAMRDLERGGQQLLFPSDFTRGSEGIGINGLIWMGDYESMKQQVEEKIESGFRVIKIKVGALELDRELELISYIRSRFNPRDLEIRLDANGSWEPGEAARKLEQFAPFGIHSIEQPIDTGQWEAMRQVCKHSPIPVALDEELIGLDVFSRGSEMLSLINPAYIILKPGLIGGFRNSEKWIQLAEERATGWWITSALESSVGLSAIAQWTYQQGVRLTQGLGTGAIYRNNIPSPLEVAGNFLFYRKNLHWELEQMYHG
jgi:O-succinylbenzoate synthase